MKKITLTLLALALLSLTTGCSPEVGSPEWCEMIKEKPKGDWTMQETKDYARHCLF